MKHVQVSENVSLLGPVRAFRNAERVAKRRRLRPVERVSVVAGQRPYMAYIAVSNAQLALARPKIYRKPFDWGRC